MEKIRVIYKSRDEIEEDCKKWALELFENYRPDIIIFIAKSGYLFAKPLSECFHIPMVDIKITRPGNSNKDTVRRFIPWIPRWLLSCLLKSKSVYGYQERNIEREVVISDTFETIKWSDFKNILIVDDSTDTGWSLIEAKRVAEKYAPDAKIKTLSYCVIDISEKRVSVDYYRFKNTIVVSATSRYSKENTIFMKDYNDWQRSKKKA